MAKRQRKRQYGSGTVVPPATPGGTWAIRLRVGKQRRYEGGISTRELAERALAKVQADGDAKALGLPVAPGTAGAVGDYATPFLARRKVTHAEHSTSTGTWRKHLGPAFDTLLPRDVDHGTIRRYIEGKLAAGLAPGTVRIHVALLSSLFEELVEDSVVSKNPARGLPKRLVNLMRPSHDPRTTPFVERLSDVQRIYAGLPEPLNVAYAIGAFAGLRTSEVFGLRWRHVDLATRRMHIREQRGLGKNGKARTLKDKESRIVPVLDALLPVLTRWKLERGGEGDAVVIPPLRADGEYIAKSTPGKYLRATLAELGLQRPGLGWYEATRHTFASQWVMSGGSIEKLKEILGHHSVVVTERYAHLRVDLFTAKDLATIPVVLQDTPARVVRLERESAG